MILEKSLYKIMGKLKQAVVTYDSLIFTDVAKLDMQFYQTKDYHDTYQTSHKTKQATEGMKWGGDSVYGWFKGDFCVPKELEGKKLYIRPNTGAYEGLVWLNKEPWGNFASKEYWETRGNHYCVRAIDNAKVGEQLNVELEMYAWHCTGGCMPFEPLQGEEEFIRTYQGVYISTMDEEVKNFTYDLRVLLELWEALEDRSFRKAEIANCLTEVFKVIYQEPKAVVFSVWHQALLKAREEMRSSLEAKNGDTAPYAGIIGHSHMDTAWLWKTEETIKKCARTYSEVLNLMEQYPEYTFIQSSALHLKFMEEHYPSLFKRIKEKILQGRYEPNGGVWVECDCNITSGESMIRQFLWGQKYTKEKFGYLSDTFWLPDTFGYSAAIPQIMKGVGIKYFATTKLSWNDTNKFPYDTFIWRGIDGSEVFAHFNDTHGWPAPKNLIERLNGNKEENYVQHKRVNNARLISYGCGDGGGGPEFGMLETARRTANLDGCPKVYHTTVSQFMKKLNETCVDTPILSGELYLEGHRGTLTGMHDIKYNNRKAEFALRDLEIFSILCMLKGEKIQKERIDAYYEILLLNQFHDILPGTCLHLVNEKVTKQMSKMCMDLQKDITKLAMSLSDGNSNYITVWNTLTHSVNGQVKLPCTSSIEGYKTQTFLNIEGKEECYVGGITVEGFNSIVLKKSQNEMKAISPFMYEENHLETPFAKVIFDEYGYIKSFYDKQGKRELCKGAYPLNALCMGEDIPMNWDNWDIDEDLQFKLQMQTKLVNSTVVSNGALQFRIRNQYEIGNHSELVQDVVFYSDNPRVDFETIVNWKDKHQFLKTMFDVDINASFARHDIQFGFAERPTYKKNTYEATMFEVCNHKYTDLSETNYGVAILNDCKYGISVNGSIIGLSLHKGGTHPDATGDQGIHKMTYSMLPHTGGFCAETVVNAAYELNKPPVCVVGKTENIPFIGVIDKNIAVEAVKPAEDGKGFIVRIYETEKSRVCTKITLPDMCKEVELTNMLEEKIENIEIENSQIELELKPFEIKTLKIM